MQIVSQLGGHNTNAGFPL